MKRDYTHHLGDDEKALCERFLGLIERGVHALEESNRRPDFKLQLGFDDRSHAGFEELITLGGRLLEVYSRRKPTTPQFTFPGGKAMLIRVPSDFPNTLVLLSLPTEIRDTENRIIALTDIGVRLVSNNETAVLIHPTDDPLVNEIEIVGQTAEGLPNVAAVSLQVYFKDGDVPIGSIDGAVVEVHHGKPGAIIGARADFSGFGEAVVASAPVPPPPPPPLPDAGATTAPLVDGEAPLSPAVDESRLVQSEPQASGESGGTASAEADTQAETQIQD